MGEEAEGAWPRSHAVTKPVFSRGGLSSDHSKQFLHVKGPSLLPVYFSPVSVPAGIACPRTSLPRTVLLVCYALLRAPARTIGQFSESLCASVSSGSISSEACCTDCTS